MIRLFVAGYPREAAKEDIVALFRQFGATEDDVTFPRDRRTRRKKGYAYVNVRDNTAAEGAIRAFNLFEIDGKQLTVMRAEDRPLKKRRR
ncbi:MAG: RNA-binding protein [Candidatus Eremiobacteraeota bacterium]|nr:RNA-binding protein [Candidatus Eremiobacteraeota bacterium]